MKVLKTKLSKGRTNTRNKLKDTRRTVVSIKEEIAEAIKKMYIDPQYQIKSHQLVSSQTQDQISHLQKLEM